MRDRSEVISFACAAPERTGIFLDFDGTVSAIVPRPEDAVAVPGAVAALERLASVYRLVAVVSGRSLSDLVTRVPARGVLLAGTYGRERSDRPGELPNLPLDDLSQAVADAVTGMPGVRVEQKDSGVALHYRAVPERAGDVRTIAEELGRRFGVGSPGTELEFAL